MEGEARVPVYKTKSNRRRRSEEGRKVEGLKGDSHLDVAGECGEEVRERVAGVAVVMEVREHPGRDPFKILRFLVLIFFAA